MGPLPQENAEVIVRHRLPVRLWHWISVLAIVGLLFTGFCILNVHPRLYWGEVGNAYTPALFALDSSDPGGPRPTTHPAPAVLVVGNRRFDVTGRLGVVADAGGDGLYFLIANTPGKLAIRRHASMALHDCLDTGTWLDELRNLFDRIRAAPLPTAPTPLPTAAQGNRQ